jgi:malonyl-CoA/methylmalonyl-CoA synthetase
MPTNPPLVARCGRFAERTAIVARERSYRYQDLDHASARAAGALLAGRSDLGEHRVCFLVSPSFEHAAVQWGIWRAGGVAVPLAVSHPATELEYVIRDAEAATVVADAGFAAPLGGIARRAGARFVTVDEVLGAEPRPLPDVGASRRAMMVYTSGTTGRPKGVVTSHASITAQITSLVGAWEWTPDDRVLLVLPLHHVHGIVNVLGCALWSGATCEIHPRFDAATVWDRLGSGDLTLFMAVPTMYHRLIAAWDDASPVTRNVWSAGCRRVRLMVSGSAALPVTTLERWREITGHTLLERYGMTEIGMALSNPLHGERRPGTVGRALPGVDVRLVDDAGDPSAPGAVGEIEVRGPQVFLEYWRRPDATREAFRDGWFRTGDLSRIEDGYYRILGRTSVDIIKTGGFKVSALEIEEELRQHPSVAECAVIGVNDPEWGERIAAAVELVPGTDLSLEQLQHWARDRLAPYKLPRALLQVTALPRNAMGKVMKPEISRLFPVPER